MKNADEILQRMNQNQKINYDRILQKLIQSWQDLEERPKILMHACCAPCSTYSLEYLCDYADLTIYYYNNNIHPRNEWERRRIVLRNFVNDFNEKTGHDVKMVETEYQPNTYLKEVTDLHDEPEGGLRCNVCYNLRLTSAALYAQENNYDYFGTSLTISPHKNAQTINQIGIEIQHLYNTKWLPSDFKKNNGFQRSTEMCEEYNIYRQSYCGCLFAARQMDQLDLRQISKDADRFVELNGESQSNFDLVEFNFQHEDL
ncbi:epoxyqueuosine reductase QueH [Xylocopilactobacillus apicola]|nr:epoxyqueuosine reductase QueH [Xylocopilactobacillus apicola]